MFNQNKSQDTIITTSDIFDSEIPSSNIDLINGLRPSKNGQDRTHITVTQPFLPPLDEFIQYLQAIWSSKQVTNRGQFHIELEEALCDYLGVEHISLFTNGTLALLVALQALRITGEVITTPYSFVATTHALHWNGIKPVFCDIEPETMNLDPDKIEAAITPNTTAIMPVHIYGTPCDVERLEHIANIYGLKVIYDAAHAFGVRKNNQSILDYGDMSVLSFHGTKVFTTFEGGAIISHSASMKERIDFLKNFGFADEVTVVGPGINGKMNEFQAALGLLQLKYIDHAIEQRKYIASMYTEKLQSTPGIRLLIQPDNIRFNYAYYPIFIEENRFGCSRDEVYEGLKKKGFYGRRYFFPLISHFPTYRGLPSAAPENLPVAERITREVICLPLHLGLTDSIIDDIVAEII